MIQLSILFSSSPLLSLSSRSPFSVVGSAQSLSSRAEVAAFECVVEAAVVVVVGVVVVVVVVVVVINISSRG